MSLLLLFSASGLPPIVEMSATGFILIEGEAPLTADATASLAAVGSVSLSGSAWLSPRDHGQDTFIASGSIRLRGTAVRLSSYGLITGIVSVGVGDPPTVTVGQPHGLGSTGSTGVVITGVTGTTPAVDGTYTATLTGPFTFTIPIIVTVGSTGGSAVFTAAPSQTLPATDGYGWTAPARTPPDLLALEIVVQGYNIGTAQIDGLDIDLDCDGGPRAATLSVNCALDRAPHLGTDTLLVTYKGQTLFRGRLENIAGNLSSSTGYTLTFAGPLVTLRDHKAFRTVFVDSDLQSWKTDQGPRTSPDVFEVMAG